MTRAAVELDFFGLEKANSNSNASKSQFQKFLHRRSFRGIHGSISKIDPQLLKTVIESGSASQNKNRIGSPEDTGKSVSVPSSPKRDQIFAAPLPVYNPVSEISADSAPLTIFYNGVVTVYDVPRDKAESILKLAVEGRGKAVEPADPRVAAPSTDQNQLLETLNNGDLPIFRKKSLQRFMEKRRERLTLASPYASPL